MKKSLLISAAALIAGSGLAFAQGTPGGAVAPERAPAAAQQGAPAEKTAPPATTGQGSSKSNPDAAQVPAGSSRAQDMKKDTQPETTGQADKAAPDAKPQARDAAPSRDGKSSQTTGQGAASTSSNLTTQQRTKISTTIKQQNVKPVTKVNFSIAIGTTVPRDMTLHALPTTVIEVYPAWRGYQYILVEDEILVIDPATFRIVAILEA